MDWLNGNLDETFDSSWLELAGGDVWGFLRVI
jgi:hypothetical protein